MFGKLFLYSLIFFAGPILYGIEKMNPALLSSEEWRKVEVLSKEIVISSKRIELPGYPGAFNPSILKVEKGYLLSFRFMPDPLRLWLSYIGVVLLDEEFDAISTVQLLDTRKEDKRTLSQAEDARLFSFEGRIYLIYNDSLEIKAPSNLEHRDMFLAELIEEDGVYELSSLLKLRHPQKYHSQFWQKNWVPFDYQGKLLMTYSLDPHEILNLNWATGICNPVCETKGDLPWKWGPPRGSTPPILVEGEYFAFLHSGIMMRSKISGWNELWHYFMGAYTFSSDPPFEITKMTPFFILDPTYYQNSKHPKRVIFPGGCVVDKDLIYVAYGKDDCEMWVSTIDKNKLFKKLQPVQRKDK